MDLYKVQTIDEHGYWETADYSFNEKVAIKSFDYFFETGTPVRLVKEVMIMEYVDGKIRYQK
jgi:hypothetical protein